MMDEEQIARGELSDRALETAATLEDLFVAYDRRLRRFLSRRGGRPGSIDDLVHETLLRAANSIASFDRSKPMWPWLRTIALNTLIAEARKQSREVCYEDLESLIGSAPEDRCDDHLLDEALAAVPRRQRVALSLRYLDDWSPLEAASFLGVSRSSFDQLLSRGRRKLCIEYQRLRAKAQLIVLLSGRSVRKLVADVRGHPLMVNSVPGADFATQLLGAAAAATILIAGGTPSAPRTPVPQHRAVAATQHRPATEPVGKRKPPAKDRVDAPAHEAERPAEDAGATSGAVPGATGTPADDVTDPNRGVKKPEQTEVGSVAFADDENHTAYAAGQASCATPYCPPVLFVSRDRGRSWDRLPAVGLQGTLITVPPGHADNHTIFAMSPEALQISRDGGRSFLSVTPTGLSLAMGSVAVSPLFDQGDPTVLVGAQTLMRYSDGSGVMDPFAGSLHGPFDPAFSSSYPHDPLFYLGAMRADGLGGLRATVFTCHSIGCTYTSLPSLDQMPRLRTASIAGEEHLYAFTEKGLFMSLERARFERLTIPSTEGDLRDLRPLGDDGRLIAAVGSLEGSPGGGIYLSPDGGRSWQRSSVPGNLGTHWIAASGDRILAALTGRGLVCSDDGGNTFHRRCS